MFEKFSRQAGKKQHLILHFIAAHPGTTTKICPISRCGSSETTSGLDQVDLPLHADGAGHHHANYSGKNLLKKVATPKRSIPFGGQDPAASIRPSALPRSRQLADPARSA